MSLKKTIQVREAKFFRSADLIVYSVIAAIVVLLFIILFFLKDDGALRGIRIYVRNEIVFEYIFEEDKFLLYQDCVEVEDGEKLIVKVGVFDGYNIVEIDKSARTVRVTDADCRTRECVNTPPITGRGEMIFCSPHRVSIVPYDYEDDGKTVIM